MEVTHAAHATQKDVQGRGRGEKKRGATDPSGWFTTASTKGAGRLMSVVTWTTTAPGAARGAPSRNLKSKRKNSCAHKKQKKIVKADDLVAKTLRQIWEEHAALGP